MVEIVASTCNAHGQGAAIARYDNVNLEVGAKVRTCSS
jgi:hypothetical protein